MTTQPATLISNEGPATPGTNPSIFAALAAVMGDVQAVRKGDRNQVQNYNFRGVDAVVNAVGPALRKHGVIVVPLVEHVAYNTVEVGQRRTPMRECTVRVRYVFYGPAGDTVECVSAGEAMDSGDKSTPKAMSVAFRVALLQALCIPTDEPEADAATYQRAPARADRTRRSSTPDGGDVSRETGSEQGDQGGMTAPQRRRMMALFGQAGYTKEDRAGRIGFTNALLPEGRTVSSANELTADEAGLIIASLEAGLAESHDEPGDQA